MTTLAFDWDEGRSWYAALVANASAASASDRAMADLAAGTIEFNARNFDEAIRLQSAAAARFVAAIEQQPERAARIAGAVEVQRTLRNLAFEPMDRARYQAELYAARSAVGERRFRRAMDERAALTLDQAMAYALELP